jgi:hypothetical protein
LVGNRRSDGFGLELRAVCVARSLPTMPVDLMRPDIPVGGFVPPR